MPLFIVLSFFPPLFHKQEILFFLLFFSALWVSWQTGRGLTVRTPITLPLLAFILWVLITIPFAIDPMYSFGEWRKLLVQAFVFYWGSLVLRDQAPETVASRVLFAVLVGAGALSCVSIQDFIARGGTWRDRVVRAWALGSDYNWLTTYMVIAIPLIVSAFASFKERWKQGLAVLVAAGALIAQAASYTRAGWLGMVAEGLTLAALTARRKIVVGIVLGILLSTAGLFYLAQLGYQKQTVDPWTFDARLAVWKLQASEVLEHPLTGIGYGSQTFMKRFESYEEAQKANGPHSTFLMVAMGSGIPAVLCLLWVFIASWRALLAVARKSSGVQHYFLLAVIVMLAGFFIRNLFDYMFAGSLGYLFWVVLAAGHVIITSMHSPRSTVTGRHIDLLKSDS